MNNGDLEKKTAGESENTPSEVFYDNKNSEDIKSGEEEGKQVTEEKVAADEVKEESSAQEDNDAGKEEQADKEVGGASDISGRNRYSANYAPPHYVPNFTVVGEPTATIFNGGPNAENEPKKKQKKSFSNGVVIAICAATLVLSLIIGTVAGAIAGGVDISDILLGGNNEEIVHILRGDSEITVNEIPGNTGYGKDLTVAQVAALVGQSVVEITTTHVKTSIGYEQYITSGAGSGVIFDQNGTKGYIVTNYHVIEGADEITVRIKNGDSYNDYKATYLAGDAAEDIAVITVTVNADHTLSRAVFGDSDKLIVGEEVVAIGNPLGQLGGTVTDGIISALDREIIVEDNTMVLLQTNAAINPGNSGGGLFNMAGELVGIVNAKQSSAGIEGLGFAIPANVVVKDIGDILELGYIAGRVTLGIVVQYGQLSGQMGVFVTNAGNTQFRYGDRILKINDTAVSSLSDYNKLVKELSVGQTASVQVARDGRIVTVNVTAQENKSAY